MSWEDILVYVIDAAAGIIIAIAIPWLAKMLKGKVDSDIAQSLVTQAEKTVTDCVIMVNQTFVDALKAEGKFDKNAAEAAFERCRSEVLAILSEAAKEAVISTVGDFEAWLNMQIESNVRLSKREG